MNKMNQIPWQLFRLSVPRDRSVLAFVDCYPSGIILSMQQLTALTSESNKCYCHIIYSSTVLINFDFLQEKIYQNEPRHL